ncbi:MAG: endolytic transglycosylase MltG [Lachnospiraceae bacterium]|nr:endolytic transglycosylase MltG [Lachnospiraceae bacterium]
MNVNKVVLTILSTAIRCIILMAIFVLLVQGGKKAYIFGMAVFMDEPMTGEENARQITVTIPEGAGAKEIGEILERKNLIRDSLVFYVQSFCVEEGKKLKGGRYDLSTAMSAEKMMEIIAENNSEEKSGE